MSSSEAPRCRHIKVSGTQCGSPAVRSKSFCYYHQQHRPIVAECYSDGEYSTGEILLPVFEDAHSVQSVIRQVMQMVLQKRIERKTASLLLYALQIASSNLKRMELEKPQPEQVVIDVVTPLKWQPPIAAPELTEEEARETAEEASAPAQLDNAQLIKPEPSMERSRGEEELPPGTIQACHRPRQCESNSTKTETSARKLVQGTRREASYKLKPKLKVLSYPERKGEGWVGRIPREYNADRF
jgi:hypothetical protein